ncbi:MAG: LysM peptidoglycan-binding domain-containing protein [Anaerolineaceae bacterium]|nr:LysM peptidoglycan-binding domain-containing protein [Anaerolineaceae bacterium]
MRQKAFFFILVVLLLTSVPAVFADAIEPDLFRENLLETLNTLRDQYNCGPLAFDEHLQTSAQHQAEFLAKQRKLQTGGPAGESIRQRAYEAGYGGSKSFTIQETNAMVWIDTDADYLIEQVWRENQASKQVIFNQAVRQAGIGIADTTDKHRFIVLTLAGLDDGTDDYSITEPTYDYRTPKPTVSATPTIEPFVTSTMNPDGGVYHIVKEGETFSEIALAYGLDWYTLANRNYIKLSDTTPVVIMEGQRLVIQPTFTLTPTPTPTKTPVPPTNTPRPTFTPGSGPAQLTVPTTDNALPAPSLKNITDGVLSFKQTIGWILVGICIPGLLITLWKKK